jgi:hypothetical protein
MHCESLVVDAHQHVDGFGARSHDWVHGLVEEAQKFRIRGIQQIETAIVEDPPAVPITVAYGVLVDVTGRVLVSMINDGSFDR